MKNFTLFVLCVLSVSFVFAQQKGKASITIFYDQQLPVENATVELLRSKDSGLVKTALTDKAGLAEFENIGLNSYIIRATVVGLKTGYSNLFTINESQLSMELSSISLVAKPAAQMQTVTVAAKKPFIQKLNDRIVVNVESSMLNAGSSAIEVLER